MIEVLIFSNINKVFIYLQVSPESNQSNVSNKTLIKAVEPAINLTYLGY